MTLRDAKSLVIGSTVHHITNKNADGSPMRAKVLSVKTWKTRPEQVVVSLRRGLRDFAKYTENEIRYIEKGTGY